MGGKHQWCAAYIVQAVHKRAVPEKELRRRGMPPSRRRVKRREPHRVPHVRVGTTGQDGAERSSVPPEGGTIQGTVRRRLAHGSCPGSEWRSFCGGHVVTDSRKVQMGWTVACLLHSRCSERGRGGELRPRGRSFKNRGNEHARAPLRPSSLDLERHRRARGDMSYHTHRDRDACEPRVAARARVGALGLAGTRMSELLGPQLGNRGWLGSRTLGAERARPGRNHHCFRSKATRGAACGGRSCCRKPLGAMRAASWRRDCVLRLPRL